MPPRPASTSSVTQRAQSVFRKSLSNLPPGHGNGGDVEGGCAGSRGRRPCRGARGWSTAVPRFRTCAACGMRGVQACDPAAGHCAEPRVPRASALCSERVLWGFPAVTSLHLRSPLERHRREMKFEKESQPFREAGQTGTIKDSETAVSFSFPNKILFFFCFAFMTSFRQNEIRSTGTRDSARGWAGSGGP